MKKNYLSKVFVIASIVLSVSLMSCEKESDEKSCWTFSMKMVTSASPSVPGYPKTVTSDSKQCGLTEAEANEVVEKLTTTTTSSSGGYRVTVKTTVTKKKASDKPITGERVPNGSQS